MTVVIEQSKFEVGEEFKKGEVLIQVKDEDIDLELKSIKSQFLSLLVQVLPDLKMDFPSLGSKFQQYVNNFNLQGNIATLPQTAQNKETFSPLDRFMPTTTQSEH